MTHAERPPHTVRAFDEDIDRIRSIIQRCGDLASRQVLDAVGAMMRRDLAAAGTIEMLDEQVDELQAEAEQEAISTIGRRAPLADDLRDIIAAIKIAGELERVGDYAKNIAKRTPAIAETATVEPAIIIPTIAELVVSMIRDALSAYQNRDVDAAMEVIQRDRSVDEFYNSLFRSLLVHMIESPQQTTQAAHLLFVAKNLERVGDHATNIAELVYYSATGRAAASRKHETGTAYESVPVPDA
jgi:phosphate transport system protein